MKYTNLKDFKKVNTFKTGIPNFFLAKYMTGKTYLRPVKMAGRSMMLANVTFSPGARCFWHVHRSTKGGGQILICTAGEGWYQEEGKDAISLKPGDVVHIPTDLLHWHGSKADSWFSHIAVELGGENVKNEFVRPVLTGEYDTLKESQPQSTAAGLDSSFDNENVFGKGNLNDKFSDFFIGDTYLKELIKPENDSPSVINVTFEPGSRNNWHIHDSSSGGGKVLVCTAGEGWYQQEGKKAKSLSKGDVVYITTGVKHWHGAKKNSWFSFLAIDAIGENREVQWLEEVKDSFYASL